MSAAFSVVGDAAAEIDEAARVRVHVAAVAANLAGRLDEVTLQMRDVLARRVPELEGGAALLELLGASVEENLVTILRELQFGIEACRHEPPTAAVDYARRLAQRGFPVNALVRSYWLGQQSLLRLAFEASQCEEGDEAVRAEANDVIVRHVFDYIDWISQRLVAVYEAERQAWLSGQSRSRSATVRQLLDGDESVDISVAQDVLGYRLGGHHVAVVAWVPESRLRSDQWMRSTRTIRAFAKEIGAGAPLVTGYDQATMWAWLPVCRGWTWKPELAQWAGGDPTSPMLALGGCQVGPSGFRRSHEQALQVQRTAHIGGMRARTVMSYEEPGVAPTVLLSQNLDVTRAWVREVLGDLARDDEPGERHRHTLLTLLRNDMNQRVTAEQMVMHRNSIKNRIDGAEALLGRPVAGNRLSVELALTACEWLGPVVLSPVGGD